MSDAALAAALADALAGPLPPPVRVLARRPSLYASSFPLFELDVEDGAGTRHALVWKDLTPSSLTAAGRAARGGAAPDPAHELRAYELLERAGLGTPRRVAALHDDARAWLLLERVEGARLEHVGELDAWERVARWLARAHAALAGHTELPAWSPPAAVPPVPVALAAPLAAARARVARLPHTTIHGELYPANVLLAGERVCVVDWETVARGPALLDLAALTAGRWDEPGEPLAEAYRRALPDPPPPDGFRADLDACRLLVAARWLAAPHGWEPPPEQTRDWRADADLVARRMMPA